VQLARPQRQPHAAGQRRVGIAVEVGIAQVGELAAAPVDLDDVGALDLAQVGPAAAS
jgi:hypothetical protein